MTENTPFGLALRAIRADLSLSQADLALTLGSTQRHVSFLETGRSAPTREMLGRIVAGLGLGAGRRAQLFEASGFRNPYPYRAPDDPEIAAAIDVIETRILAHWPFPAFALDRDWTIFAQNRPAAKMMSLIAPDGVPGNSFLELMLAPGFGERVANWNDAARGLYLRLVAASARSVRIAETFARARREGRFDAVEAGFAAASVASPLVPLILSPSPGIELSLTSLVGHLVAVNDAGLEDVEVELLVPVDAQSEAMLAALSAP